MGKKILFFYCNAEVGNIFEIRMSQLVTILTLRISADADNILELEMSLEPRISLIVTYTDIADIYVD